MNIQTSFAIENEIFYYYDLEKVFSLYESLRELPISLKILLEENLRKAKDDEEIEEIIDIFLKRKNSQIKLYPSRMIMQGFTGISSLIDLATMRDKVKDEELNKINPQIMVDLILDDILNEQKSDEENKIDQNKEKYEFLKWAENKFENIRIVPPDSGIFHQINLEYLSTIVHLEQIDGKNFLFPETLVGTNSQYTRLNSIGVIGLKVDGFDIQSSILGLPLSFNLPKVVGIKISGMLCDGVLSSDLLSAVESILKDYAIFGKIVEFYGEGLYELALEDKTIISNIVFKLGAVSSFFPIDDKTLLYYDNTKENDDFSKLIKMYLEKQSLFFDNKDLTYDETIEIDLSSLVPHFYDIGKSKEELTIDSLKNFPLINKAITVKDGDIVLSVINASIPTLNPYLFIHAGLVAKKAYELGFRVNKNIKKSLILNPLIKEYLEKVNLLKYFEYMGFRLSGFDCEANYQLDNNIEEEIKINNLKVISVSFNNENISPLIKANYSMSTSLVIVYTLAESIRCDIQKDCIGKINHKEIKLHEIWPNNELVIEYLNKLDSSLYKNIYKNIFRGSLTWQEIEVENSSRFQWNDNSTYVQASKSFDNMNMENQEITNAGILAIFTNTIMAKDISPFGKISLYSPSANYLEQNGVKSFDYNTFASREANAEVMIRSSFDSDGLKNRMVSKEGGYTKDFEKDEIVSIYELSSRFKEKSRPLVIFAGREYGCEDSRDWTSKCTALLGVKAIIATSFDKVHKTNLIKMGILPLEFIDDDIETLNLKGDESISISATFENINEKVELEIKSVDEIKVITVLSRIDTNTELIYYNSGGILTYLLRNLV